MNITTLDKAIVSRIIDKHLDKHRAVNESYTISSCALMIGNLYDERIVNKHHIMNVQHRTRMYVSITTEHGTVNHILHNSKYIDKVRDEKNSLVFMQAHNDWAEMLKELFAYAKLAMRL